MAKEMQLHADGRIIRMTKVNGEDYVCLTDIARQKNADFPADVVRNWMRSKATVAFLGLWEQLHNPDFKLVEFDQFRDEAGSNAFVLPPQVWIEKTNAIGMFSKAAWMVGETGTCEDQLQHPHGRDTAQPYSFGSHARADEIMIYASEADVLNVALFGKTHQQWQRENPTLKGN